MISDASALAISVLREICLPADEEQDENPKRNPQQNGLNGGKKMVTLRRQLEILEEQD
jgi:hypothetical protein